ncbi:spindle and kinetochore-associated protein 1-like isoform X2 [Ceratina calcarata]|uniref:SKA complex subunit 1 n=1 Tax=Ceratina calcarata TaxID=156304 RepID=A0AAJ7W8S3_9HYME|nr:spindle and kinetochore-associated protein 1-like isoform X2 [Ceratina calcarata]
MSTCDSLDVILEQLCEKLRNLETVTVFFQNGQVIKDELLNMRSIVTQISNGVEVERQRVSQMREEIDAMKLNRLDQKIIHMDRNVPQRLLNDYQIVESSTAKIKPKKEISIATPTPMKNCKKMLFNEPEVYYTIPLITQEEFSKIPKYIIGRQSLDAVNSLVNTINEIIQAKYTFLSLGKAHARKQGDLNLFLYYKRQEMDMNIGNECVYFFTNEDYEKHTTTKLNKIKLNLLVVLRHCKRIREWRSKNDTRYVICTG